MMRFSVLFVLVISSCSSIEHVVESDYSYSGNFKRYENFDISDNRNFEGSREQALLIENGIAETLENWGYKRRSSKPDLIIFYNIYSEDFNLISFDQPEFQHWISTTYSRLEFEDSAQTNYAKSRVTESYDKSPALMKEGTIQITFFDRKRKEVVWQGYSSGYLERNSLISKYDFKAVINRVLYEYRLLAKNRNRM